MIRCKSCNSAMIRASNYDPEGTISLHGGIKEYNDDNSLKEWWICTNRFCDDGYNNQILLLEGK